MHCCQHLLAGEQIQTGSGFIQNQQLWLEHQCPGNQAAHALAAAEGSKRLMDFLLKTDLPDQFYPPPLHGGSGFLEQTDRAEKSGQYDAQRGLFRIKFNRAVGLHQTNGLAELVQIGFAEWLAEHGHFTMRRPHLPHDDADQRALAAAIGPQDGRTRFGGDGPVDIPQDRSLTADDGYRAKFHSRLPLGPLWVSFRIS